MSILKPQSADITLVKSGLQRNLIPPKEFDSTKQHSFQQGISSFTSLISKSRATLIPARDF
jgi:hypothetical protein